MVNGKLWVASLDGVPQSRPPQCYSPRLYTEENVATNLEAEEGLRLIRAFCRIGDRTRRERLIIEAERMSLD